MFGNASLVLILWSLFSLELVTYLPTSFLLLLALWVSVVISFLGLLCEVVGGVVSTRLMASSQDVKWWLGSERRCIRRAMMIVKVSFPHARRKHPPVACRCQNHEREASPLLPLVGLLGGQLSLLFFNVVFFYEGSPSSAALGSDPDRSLVLGCSSDSSPAQGRPSDPASTPHCSSSPAMPRIGAHVPFHVFGSCLRLMLGLRLPSCCRFLSWSLGFVLILD